MDDILSAASLLLTIVTVLYALWYQAIVSVLQIEIPKFAEDRPKPLSIVNKVLLSRALPLFLMSLIVSAVFTPDMIKLFCEYLKSVISDNSVENFHYNSLKTAFFFVVIFSIGITIHSGNILRKLFLIKRKMSE